MGKILIINTVPTEKNGITNVIFNYLSATEEKGGIFDYVSLNDPDEVYKAGIKRVGGTIYVLNRSSKGILSYLKSLNNIIKANTYDIVHIHGNSHTVVLELIAAKNAGCRVRIVHAHSTRCNSLVVHRILTPLFNYLCTHRIACGKDAGSFMFGRKPFTVMNNGIVTRKYAFKPQSRKEIKEKLGWVDCNIIGHVGYFMALKNQSFIVDVFESIYKQNPDYRVILIGDGPMREEIQNKLDSKGLSKMACLTGNIDNVNDYLNAIDVIVMPSLFEGVPLTLIEQQANGLPCVVADTITKEADKTGNLRFLSLKAPVEEWAQAVISEDGISREERSKKAIEDITKAGYSIEEEARTLVKYYQELLTNKG